MKHSCVTLSLCLSLVFAFVAHAQTGRQRPREPRAITNVLETKVSRAAVVRLKSGETLDCNFIRADENAIEIEAGGELRVFKLDEVLNISFASLGPEVTRPTASRADAAAAPLVVSYRECDTNERFTELKGVVRNASAMVFPNLTAVATFRSRSGAVVRTGRQLLGNVPAGQTLSFKVVSWHDPRIASCAVSFKIFKGASVPHAETLER
jgi:hypothetical protein